MARTEIPLTEINREPDTPATPTAGDVTNGNYVVNDGRVFIEPSNSDAAEQTLTVVLPGTVDGQDITDRAYAVPTGGSLRPIGPFPVSTYGDQLALDPGSALVEVVAYHLPDA